MADQRDIWTAISLAADEKSGALARRIERAGNRWLGEILDAMQASPDAGRQEINSGMPGFQREINDAKMDFALPIALESFEATRALVQSNMRAMSMASAVCGKVVEPSFDDSFLNAAFLRAGIEDYINETSRLETETTADLYQRAFLAAQAEIEDFDGVPVGGDIAALTQKFQQTALAANENRAILMARTLTIWAANEGAHKLYEREGIAAKQWIAARDELTCPWCATLDGSVTRTGDRFFDAGDEYTVSFLRLQD